MLLGPGLGQLAFPPDGVAAIALSALVDMDDAEVEFFGRQIYSAWKGSVVGLPELQLSTSWQYARTMSDSE
jgi:hypothetical protein